MKHSLNFEGIGTKWNIDFDTTLQTSIDEHIVGIVNEFENLYSRFKQTSILSAVSNTTGTRTVPAEFIKLLSWYEIFYVLTEGLFTPLIGQTLTQSGYDKDYSFQEKEFTKVPALDSAVHIKSETEIILSVPVQFDFGGVGKGYLIDKIAQYFKSKEINNFVINGGGDIYHSSIDSTRAVIGLENPVSSQEVIGTFDLQNKSICSSAGNRRKWDKHHHIINPFTFSSPKDIVATWVVADSALLADTLSTCLFFVPPSVFQHKYVFDYVIVDKNLSASYSAAFNNSLFV